MKNEVKSYVFCFRSFKCSYFDNSLTQLALQEFFIDKIPQNLKAPGADPRASLHIKR
jgi:hypothetical protein